ncbi:MAG TPA: bestrophin family ion channel, partial [Polyangiaceae bacterium]|nr:bestrophin family ion channel [Polyangiaceae bacterium]
MVETSETWETHPELQRRAVRDSGLVQFITTHALRRAWLLSVLSGLYAIVAVFFPWHDEIDLPFEALLTFAVGLMLSVRVRAAYERWWEGRTQWGILVNTSRNLAVKFAELSDATEEERRSLQRDLQAFARSLKGHLRGGVQLQWLDGFGSAPEHPRHVPAHVAARIYRLARRLLEEKRLSEISFLAIDSDARALLNVCGACERIKNTPMLPSFRAFLRFAMTLLIASLPWRLADDLGWWTVPSIVLATFLIWGGEAVADAAEHPFGTERDDLDLEAFCLGIDQVTAEVLGVPPTRSAETA